MAITTLAGTVTGSIRPVDFVKSVTPAMVAGKPQSLFYLAGKPATAAAPTPGIGGEVLTTYAGQLPFLNPLSGNTYLGRLEGWATVGGTLMLCDRLWQNSGIDATSTAEQTFTASLQIPARDANGAITGAGVYGAVEVSAACGAAAPAITLKYTNSAGVADKTTTNIVATANSPAIGSFFPFGLADGDVGIQKAQSLTLSTSWLSGTVHVVLYRVIARLELQAQVTNAVDAITSGFVRAYNNTVPFLVFIPNTTTASNIFGHVVWTQG